MNDNFARTMKIEDIQINNIVDILATLGPVTLSELVRKLPGDNKLNAQLIQKAIEQNKITTFVYSYCHKKVKKSGTLLMPFEQADIKI